MIRAFAWLLAFLLALFACGCAVGPDGSEYTDDQTASQQESTQDSDASDNQPTSGDDEHTNDDNQQSSASDSGQRSSESGDGQQANESNNIEQQAQGTSAEELSVTENGTYTSKEEVALYIHTYGHLPSNFISKTKAKQAGWVSSKGNLNEVCPGKSIGGSQFYNDDGLLPEASGRTWKECDINYHGGYRGAERIVFSNDGLIYYTGDHYSSFEQLY